MSVMALVSRPSPARLARKNLSFCWIQISGSIIRLEIFIGETSPPLPSGTEEGRNLALRI